MRTKFYYTIIVLLLSTGLNAQNYTTIVSSDNVVFAGKDSNIEILDLSNPISPFLINKIYQGQKPFILDSLCFTLSSHGMDIYDISNPSIPSKVGYFEIENIYRVVVYDSHAYLGELYKGIHIIDIGDIQNPTKVGFISGGALAGAYTVYNDALYAYVGYNYAKIIDISTPSTPQTILGYETSKIPSDIAIYDSLLFFSYSTGSIHCYDGRKPFQMDVNGYPIRAGELAVAKPGQISIYKNFIVFSNWGSNLDIYDISDLGNIKIAGSIEGLSSDINDISIVGDYAYLAMKENAIFIVDLSDPENPEQIGTFTNISVNQSNKLKNYILYNNYPNPFNSSTSIKYNLHQSSNVNLAIFNSLGQKIKNIFMGFQSSGEHIYKFDAKDLPSGVYYYQLKVDNYLEVKKMQFIK